MDEKRGLFIVIEGSDGSGKTTQLGLIKERLETTGYEVEAFDFPQYDQPSSYFVKRYLEGAYGRADDVGPYTSSLFYALDRFEAAPKIRAALQQGKVVISNRFTGSNMAHQGTKIPNAEQRRGFFIWLDNLEFEMLRIPRPDITFVLRVPADVSWELMKSRDKQDVHEADRTHLERAVIVYDDMTQLFPKDFQRIDCVRGGKLLDIPTVNTMLWEKISPLLPEKTRDKSQESRVKNMAAESAGEIQEAETVVPETAPAQHDLILENASGLLTQKVERIVKKARTEYPETPVIHLPQNLVPDAQKAYQAKSSALLGLYARLTAGLTKHGMSTAEARAAAIPALMVGTAATIRIDAGDPGLETLIITLLNDNLPELQTAGANLFAQAIKLDPARFKGAEKPAQWQAPAALKSLAEDFLAENHIGDQPPVQLTAVWPRNENDLVADILYPHTSLPLRTIQDRIASWPMDRKLSVLETYVGDAHPGPVLEKAHYSWDLLCPYSTFRELQRYPSEALEIQTLTPRYGYDIPKAIEAAGLSDTYEKCFDLSLELYSALQKAGHPLEAQYATLHGHNQRWKLTQNAVQTLSLQKLSAVGPQTQRLLKQMQEQLAEAHPIVGELQSNTD